MRTDLRSLRERIRQVEAGGHRDTPLRRAYNRKLRAHRSLRGGGLDNLDGVDIEWEGSLTFNASFFSGSTKGTKKEEVTRNFKLYNCGVLEKYSKTHPDMIDETMVVLFAPDPKELKNKSKITFVDVNGNQHDFTNPEPKPVAAAAWC